MKDFWGVVQKATSTPMQEPRLRTDSSIKLNNDNGVSPIQSKRPNISSQELSKDLIDLDQDNSIKKLNDIDTSNLSNLRLGDKTMGTANKNNKQSRTKSQF